MDFKFTPAQAKHAQEVALGLYKKRRFFLPRGINEENPLPYLPVEHFREIYEIDARFQDFYSRLALNAELAIVEEELRQGISRYKPGNGQVLAECHRYSGGLEIVAMVPLHEMMKYCPSREIGVSLELLDTLYPKARLGEVAPNTVRAQSRKFDEYAAKVFWELYELQAKEDFVNKMVVVLNTQFEPASIFNDDFMEGKLNDLVTYPHLLSYLMYKAAIKNNWFSSKYYTIFSPSRRSHSRIVHESGGIKLQTEAEGGYDCKIAFATIL